MAKEVKSGRNGIAAGGKDKKMNGVKTVPIAKQVSNKEEVVDSDASTSGSEDEDEEQDVSKKGLARLMEALGEDGLSEMDKAHLGLVTGEQEEGEESDEDEEDLLDDDEDEEDFNDEDASEEEEGDMNADEEEDDEVEEAILSTKKQASSGKDSLAASLARSGLIAEEEEEEEEEDDEEEEVDEEGIPLESLSEAALAALPENVRATRMYREKINNIEALQRIRDDIALGAESKKGSLPWIETLVVSYDKSIEEEVGGQDVAAAAEDDLKRELEFYKQALHTATQGRQLAKEASLPFTRPSDYFAEMVKSDEHMERVRQKLLDERAGLKASEEAKKQRELKKFGKKVQVEKQLERTKSRKEMDEKIKGLKRKRKGGLDGGEDDDGDDFDVQLESAISDKDSKRARNDSSSSRGRGGSSRGRGGGPKMKRDARDAKFGYGGKKRYAKENTRESTNDTSPGVYRGGGRGGGAGGRGVGRGGRGGSSSRGRGGSSRGGASKRPGKARRTGGRS